MTRYEPDLRATGPAAAGTQQQDEITDPPRPEAAVMEALSLGHALLVIQRGPRAGEQLPIDADRTLVGRLTEADICLDDITVSRKHAEFLAHEDRHMVRDVGSLNGTYVNRERIDAAVLNAGDEVQIGKYCLKYHPAPAQREQLTTAHLRRP